MLAIEIGTGMKVKGELTKSLKEYKERKKNKEQLDRDLLEKKGLFDEQVVLAQKLK